MPGTITVGGMSWGIVSGGKQIGPATMTGLNAVGQVSGGTLASGDNAFTLEEPATAVAIFLGSSSPSATVKLRTNLNAGDAGVQIAPFTCSGGVVTLPLPAGTTEVILNASATVAGVELSFI